MRFKDTLLYAKIDILNFKNLKKKKYTTNLKAKTDAL